MSNIRQVRIFYAHKAGDVSARLRQEAGALLRYLREKAEGRGCTIKGALTFGSADHRNRFDGDWTEWAKTVSTARDAMSGNTLYNMIVVPEYAGGYVGKATADIIQGALSVDSMLRGTKCYLVTYEAAPDGALEVHTLTPVHTVICEDGNDYKSGWRLA
jgi:hypothetical protein